MPQFMVNISACGQCYRARGLNCGLTRIDTPLRLSLRSTMWNERLSSLALLHPHRVINVRVQDIVDEFARHPRRLKLFLSQSLSSRKKGFVIPDVTCYFSCTKSVTVKINSNGH